MTKVWNVTIAFGLLLIASASLVLRRGESTTSIFTQLVVFIILGAILLILGLVMRYIQRGETGPPDIDIKPYSLGILGVAACLTGLYWSTAGEGEWPRYAKLPVTPLADIETLAEGTSVRLEGLARHDPPLRAADGSPLALQRVEFSHEEGGGKASHRKTVNDYVGVLPKGFVLWDRSGKVGAAIFTPDVEPELCVLPHSHVRLNGDKEEVAKRAANAISPEFTDYHYVRGETSRVLVMSLPQDTAVTVCGVIQPPVKGVHPVRAFSISTLTGQQFELRGRNVALGTRFIAAIWWLIGLALLGVTGLAIRIYRRTRVRRSAISS